MVPRLVLFVISAKKLYYQINIDILSNIIGAKVKRIREGRFSGGAVNAQRPLFCAYDVI